MMVGLEAIYDYIITGGGTAGLALAARLVASSNYSVAVIEAGGSYQQDNGNISVVPAYWIYSAGTDPSDVNPVVDWGFVTEPQKGVDDRRMHYPRGKTLGGSSARNVMYIHRPTAGTLDKWAAEVDDESYQFDKLLPFYKKSVHYTPPKVAFENGTNKQDPNAWSSAGGPLQASRGNFVDPFGTLVQPKLENLGYPSIDGFQSGRLLGSGYLPYTVDPDRAQRSSSAVTYLASVYNNPLLEVYNHTMAEKVLLDEENKAYGIVVSMDGIQFQLKARKEVILSAGAFQSPQLLMLSGIGPRDTLQAHNIPVHVDLPGVGQNLQDHPLFWTQHRVNVPTISAALNNPAILAAAQQAYDEHAAGPLTIPAPGLIGWEKLPEPQRSNLSTSTRKALDDFPADWPELELIPCAAALGYQTNYATADPLDGYNYASIGTSMVAPLSRGTVTLASANPHDAPLIDPAYFSHPADAELAVSALRRQREVWAALKDVTIGEEYLPGPGVQSDEDIFAYIKKSVAPTWHASSTCKMGRKGDRTAIVDAEGLVFGTKGLRVVDASVFPFVLPGHPQASVYALAEKIADGTLKGGNVRATKVE